MDKREYSWGYKVRAKYYWYVNGVSLTQVKQMISEVVDIDVVPSISSMAPTTCNDIKNIANTTNKILVVDNSLATCGLCAPGLLGADIIIENMSYVPIELGCVGIGIGRESKLLEGNIAALQNMFESYLIDDIEKVMIAQSLGSIGNRCRQWSDAAQVVARFLSCHPKVSEVRYVGNEGDPSKHVASRTLRSGFGPLVHFRLKDTSSQTTFKFMEEFVVPNICNNQPFTDHPFTIKASLKNPKELWFEIVCGAKSEKEVILALEKALRQI